MILGSTVQIVRDNATFRYANTAIQRLCLSPNSQPSEPSRQRWLDIKSGGNQPFDL